LERETNPTLQSEKKANESHDPLTSSLKKLTRINFNLEAMGLKSTRGTNETSPLAIN